MVIIGSNKKPVISMFININDNEYLLTIGHTGFEPVNCGFRVRCLTNLANAQ